MKTNIHIKENLTTNHDDKQGATPPHDTIKLGIDQHADHLRIVRQVQDMPARFEQSQIPDSWLLILQICFGMLRQIAHAESR